MEWMISNWILLLIVALCIGMHFFGGHRKHGKDESDEHKSNDETKEDKKGHGCCH